MRYKTTEKVRRKMANMRAAKERKRLERTAEFPVRQSVKGKLAHTITIESHLANETHVMRLTVSPQRIDQYCVEVDGRQWKKRVGMSCITAGIRKALPPFRREQ